MSAHLVIPGRPFQTLWRYNAPYWKAYVTGILFGCVFQAVGLAMPVVFGSFVDAFDRQAMSSTALWRYFFLLVLIAAVTAVARFGQRMFIVRASRKFEYDLRNDYFRHIQGLSQSFFNRIKTGDIMARSTNDLNFVRDVMGPGIMGTVDLIRLPLSLAVLMYFSIKLTLIVMIVIPATSLIVYGILRVTRRQAHRVQTLFAGLTSMAQENLAGARQVRAYDIGDREIDKFRVRSTNYARENMKFVAIKSSISPILVMAVRLSLVLALWQGGLMVMRDETTLQFVFQDGQLGIQSAPFELGHLMGFITCLMMVSGSLLGSALVAILYQQGVAGMNRIAEILAETPAIRDSEESDQTIKTLSGRIEFKNVSFAYDESAPVLRDVSWTCEPGQTVAIVGPTGSGKSTVMAMLTRTHDPVSGQILFDGIDARRIPLKTIRSSIGVVPQDTFLFSDTIRANVTLGSPEATEGETLTACRIAQFEETLSQMDDGLDTLLGERGINLSGGQKQRLTIARAIVQDPSILLLDDALSSVDTHTEDQILAALRDVMAKRTSVIVSHRATAVHDADLILVMNKGEIAERGSHDELLASGGLYTEMHARQLLEDELEDE